ncbi:hypothetical protein OG252_04550 [Streptomyces sp. NBC_01352]|uniref:hypothetical protein n=1 Tax=Streptomyces sp. NBC_01352 TaxID=2903834 RepID=UPI002E31242B|nr:hypothetical protein [Streptomyces sp. NBC_01352]
MGSRRQDTTRGAWWTTRIAPLCPALVVLLAALVACLGFAAHADSSQAASTTLSASAIPTAAPADHHTPAVAHPADCPAGDMCCRAAVNGMRAVLVAPAQPVHAILPRTPDVPGQPDTSACSTEPIPTGRAPDLHILQVQRT